MRTVDSFHLNAFPGGTSIRITQKSVSPTDIKHERSLRFENRRLVAKKSKEVEERIKKELKKG